MPPLDTVRAVRDSLIVAAGEDEPEQGLHAQAEDHAVFGAEVVDHESSCDGAGL